MGFFDNHKEYYDYNKYDSYSENNKYDYFKDMSLTKKDSIIYDIYSGVGKFDMKKNLRRLNNIVDASVYNELDEAAKAKLQLTHGECVVIPIEKLREILGE